ncbi:DMT family transporter [Gandjariella thermophila]|uniref:DMT family transporter n=1 Tax=Gandjariella thermophila TaxID=1931992 RepID=UPI001CEF7FE0|nr:DMT family transporter [Gandjariella thermophila]
MVVLSVVLAVLASAANATASVLQRKGARREPASRSVGIPMLWDLLHQPAWVGGVVAIAAGFLLQAAALGTGPIALVQPILVFELGITLLLSGVVFHSRLHVREWAAVVGMSVGLALLLYALDPGGGDPSRAPVAAWVLGCAVSVAVVAALTIVAHRNQHGRRAAYLGVATGVSFGFTAALVTGMTAAYAGGMAGVLTAWQTYGVLVVGPAGFLLLQDALRAGRLVASQPGLTLANPLVAIGWGVAVFDEHVRGGGWITAEVGGAGLIVACTLLLARSPLLQGPGSEREEDTAPR